MRDAILISIIAVSMMVTALAASAERPMLLRVNIQSKADMEFVRQSGFDIAYVEGDFIEIVAGDDDLAKLTSAGFSIEIIHEDLVAFYQSRFPIGTTMGGFPTFDEAIAYMDSLHGVYPTLTSERQTIGQSLEGRELWMMKISDNPWADEDEPEYFVNSLIHAREPMGLEASLRFMSHLCDNYGSDPQVTDLVDNREIYFVPVVNPDGYEYNRQTNPNGGGMWRKNRRRVDSWNYGVDLNRNWGYMWGYDNNGSSPDPGSEVYRGDSTFSEPETQVMREFINGRNFSIILNIHSYGNLMLYPWGYSDIYTEDNELLNSISVDACGDNGWEIGTPWEVLYNTNGDACDWQYGERTEKPKILTFVTEIGSDWDGFWPDPNRIDDLWADELPIMLHLAEIADNPYIYALPAPPYLYPIGDVYSDTIILNWSFSDSLNPAVVYELKELSGLQRFEDGFEQQSSWWNLDGFYRRTSRRHAGSYSMFSGTANNYNGSAVLGNPVSVGDNDTLTVWVWYNIENDYDYAYVQVSTDGGVTFENLEGNITTNDNPNGTNRGNGITGSSGGWVLGIFPLADYAGRSVTPAMRYITDGGVQYEGFYADDFFPVETFENEIVISSDIPDTTFTVAGRTPGSYFYMVRALDAEDQWSVFSNMEEAVVHPQTSVDDDPMPLRFALDQNYPNPFNPQTSIEFTIDSPGRVELTVYNILGMKVCSLVDGDLVAGSYNVIFDGLDDNGKQVSAGVYFYRLRAGDFISTRKMTVLK